MEEELRALRDQDEAEAVLETALSYGSAEPVRVRIRKREDRYDIDDGGNAVRLAGEPDGWFELAQGLMTAHGLNVNRRGVVSVPTVVGRDIGALTLSVADTSVALYSALLESGSEVDFDSDTSVE